MEKQDEQRRVRGRRMGAAQAVLGNPAYIRLRNPFVPQDAFSHDQIAAIHDGALRVLEELGIKILLDEARHLFRQSGALVDEQTQMVRIGREIVTSALATAPKAIRLRAANPAREQVYELGAMLFMAGAGCPNAFDAERGRRPGDLTGYLETLRLQQSFDVIHMHGPSVEPQDVPIHLRHYAMMKGQLENCDKPLFVYSRGRQQVEESFEMIRLARGLDDAGFRDGVWASTVINSNSPRQLDLPMSRGIIDFARAGQMSIITPFCLAGAMAPITVSGALMLQHAEALAGIAVSQFARPGAPVVYGAFTTNVNMKTGAPAFGTPEYAKAALISGQLARRYRMPFRSSNINTSNAPDAQSAYESMMATWSAVAGGVNLLHQATGWLEGGLCASFEKFVLDIEMLQLFAAFLTPEPVNADSLALDAIREVGPGGHFFAAPHTLSRYETAFYAPLVSDWRNYDAWAEDGAKDATVRASEIARTALAEYEDPGLDPAAAEAIDAFVARRTEEGGAPVN